MEARWHDLVYHINYIRIKAENKFIRNQLYLAWKRRLLRIALIKKKVFLNFVCRLLAPCFRSGSAPTVVAHYLVPPTTEIAAALAQADPWFSQLWTIVWYRQNRFSVDAAALMYQPHTVVRLLSRPQAFEVREFSLSQAFSQIEFS